MGFFNLNQKNDQGFRFRPLTAKYAQAALEIVYDHDEDDGDAAQAALSGDLSAFHMVEVDGALAGFTGYSRIMEAPTSAWLSWTYVHEEFRRKGVGGYMLAELSRLLARKKVDRLFISTSDYTEDGVDIYADARRFYERVGARCDLKIPDFYEPGEAKYIYRLALGEQGFGYPSQEGNVNVCFSEIEQIDETDTAWALLWEEYPASASADIEQDDRAMIDDLIAQACADGAHAIFASLPSNLSSAASGTLQQAGFRNLGSVTDYYGPGLNDIYWGYYPNQERW